LLIYLDYLRMLELFDHFRLRAHAWRVSGAVAWLMVARGNGESVEGEVARGLVDVALPVSMASWPRSRALEYVDHGSALGCALFV
jgi:hypothetical protein